MIQKKSPKSSKKSPKKNKVIAIVGPTASGKTDLAIFLAGKFSGELISADSRQVYRGMDIGTGKDKSYPQHLIDVCDPQDQYSVAEFQKAAYKIIFDCFKKNKLPILVGGTGLYINAVLQGYQIPKTSLALRAELDKLADKDLFTQLKSYDLNSYNKIDHANRRRVLRALECAIVNKRPLSEYKQKKPDFQYLILGIDLPRQKLYDRIDQRVDKRIKQGMIEEVENLMKQGILFERLQRFGLEYRIISDYLVKLKTVNCSPADEAGKLATRNEMVEKLKFRIHDFARRQLTWFRKNKEINWIKNKKEAEKLTKSFLN
ncbi:MAG: tRNA (adenosine(37)-N6)-dimethylallyltransferase MiaA [Patescibacteria group bacterium]|nr:tRNA (adenosine(37)-N6)-dimethylallyltransferase MiaA [Patescibacteria group bacterium]